MDQEKLKPDHITKQSQPLGVRVPKEQHPLSVMGFHRVLGGLKLKDLNSSVGTHHPDYESRINHVDVDHSRFDPSTDTGQVRTHGVVSHKATGEKVGKFCRTFIRQGSHLSVHHDSFTMDDAHQGNGVAKDLLKNSVKLYRKMGAERVTTDPAAVGLYTWARMGFHYGPKGTKEVQKRLPKYLMEKHNIAPEVAQRITENVADRPWRVAALHVRGQHVGKDFMLDHGEDIWKHHGGTLELHDRNPGFRHFKKYVGIKD
jgi:GNAT superfamily N-acetyltransferase